MISIFISLNFLVLLGIDLEEYVPGLMVAQVIINVIFLIEMIILLFIYGISYAFHTRKFIKLEFFLQIVNIIAIVNFIMSFNGNALLKTLQITVIGKLKYANI